MKITVIIRNDSPMFCSNDNPSYRTVVIKLTEEQKKEIKLKQIGLNNGIPIFESYSQTILEQEETND